MKTALFLFFILLASVAKGATCTTSTLTLPDGRTMTCITCCTDGKYCSTSCL